MTTSFANPTSDSSMIKKFSKAEDDESVASLVVIDTETSGPDPFSHEVLAVSAVPLLGNGSSVEVYVDHTSIAWTEHGKRYFENYRNEWTAYRLSPQDAYAKLSQYFDSLNQEKLILVGHNVGFDATFLKRLCYQAGKPFFPQLSHRMVDTHSVLYFLHIAGKIPKEALNSSGAFSHFGITFPEGHRHTALGDAIATRELLRACIRFAK